MAEEKAQEKVDRGEYEANAFEALERDFQDVLQELVGDKSLEHFRLEYEKLHRALKKSHESEKRLIKKCRELNQEIASNASKVQTALKLSQEDQSTIGSLKKEIERAWKMVEASHEKEQRAKETIQNLKLEIGNLTKLVEQGAGLSINQENTVNNLVQQKNELTKHRDMLQAQVQKLTEQNTDLTDKVHKLDSDKLMASAEASNLKDMVSTKMTEADRENRRKERLEKELSELRENLAQKHQEFKTKQAELTAVNDKIAGLDQTLKEQRRLADKLDSTGQKLQEELALLKDELKKEIANNAELQQSNKDIQALIKKAHEEWRSLSQEKDKEGKVNDDLRRKLRVDGDAEHEIEQQRNALKGDLGQLLREIDLVGKQADMDSKQIVDLMHERDSLNRYLISADDKTKKQMEVVKVHEFAAAENEKEAKKWKDVLAKELKKVQDLEKQREKSGIELSTSNAKQLQAMEEMKNRQNKINELKKNFTDVKNRLAEQKKMHESVRAEKNMYSKNLIESQDEIAEMKRKFKIMFHQIEQLKEEIKEKNAALVRQNADHQRVTKQSERIEDDLEKVKKKQRGLKSIVETQDVEVHKLQTTIQEAEQARLARKREYESVISERDVLGTQLIRRNDELALLYEKIAIQQNTLQKGELCFQERIDEICTIKRKIASLKRELTIARTRTKSMENYKREVYLLQRELLTERTKVKALEEELENPMNVHRWRKLEGSDPTTEEMIQKVKTLQKRLIAKTEEAMDKDLKINDQDKIYQELKQILASQPPAEMVERASLYQQQLKEETRRMKSTAAEINMYQALVTESKDDIDRLTKDLRETKRKYFDQKRRDQLQKETLAHTEQP